MLDISAQRPRFSPDEAAAFARRHYNISATVTALPSERDQNFMLRHDKGQPSQRSVFKIAGAAETSEALAFQNSMLQHLGDRPQVAHTIPKLLSTVDGRMTGLIHDAAGQAYHIRLVTFLEGVPLAQVNPHTPALLRDCGRLLGRIDRALSTFEHPAMGRDLHWDLQHASRTIGRCLDAIPAGDKRALVEHFRDRFRREAKPLLGELRRSVIHNDGNDHNLLISADKKARREPVGLIDFGDAVYSCTLFEPAVAAAYVMLDKDDPLSSAGACIAGYHEQWPLTEQEMALLPLLIATRLCLSVCLSARQRAAEPENEYLSVSEAPAWEMLRRLAAVPPRLFSYIIRQACGLEPYPGHGELTTWLAEHQSKLGPVVPYDLRQDAVQVLDWSVASGQPADGDHPLFIDPFEVSAALPGIGRYDEARLVYEGADFVDDNGQRRTVHIGLDIFMPPGTPVTAPQDGIVHSFADNAAPFDYGPTIILEHQAGDGTRFHTLYGHLSRDSLHNLTAGTTVLQGQQIGRIGDESVNGGWLPHLHLQIIGDMLGYEGTFPGVASPGRRAVWRSLCPDPNLIAGIPAGRFPDQGLKQAEIAAARRDHLGPSLSVSYRQPLHIVRGRGQWLYDEDGLAYLDGVNNVCHVGHSHPRVVAALARQAAVLNTNTRYLHQNIVRLAERLLATLPDPLQVCFFVCSGSEANELALRLARTYTGAEDIIVLDGAYHGNTAALIEISPYKHDGPGGRGTPPHVQKVVMPDPYRGPYRGPYSGSEYAGYIEGALTRVKDQNRVVAAFIHESLLGCGGQVVLPEGYLDKAYKHVREAGGVCIADEVQVGFGRVGSHFWAFQTQNVVPDIVTLGKPIGNGHPLAAVITTPEIAAAFANGMEYFNTFGGNPVSCAVGLAVLDVIKEEGLQAHALSVGDHLLGGLRALMPRHPLVGDVRGRGLFIGVELVRDRETQEPAAAEAAYVVERMKEKGILLSTDGPQHNVIKIKPPLVFNEENADYVIQTLDQVLGEDPAQP